MALLTLLLIGLISGSLIKLTDDIEDKNLFNKPYAIPCGVAYGMSMGYLMVINVDASLLFGGIILGCLISGKINRMGHYFGLAAILSMLFIYGIKMSAMVLPLAVFAALDEIKDMIHVPGHLKFLFEYRLILKLGTLIFVILKFIGLDALIILIAFDGAYMLTDRITSKVNHAV